MKLLLLVVLFLGACAVKQGCEFECDECAGVKLECFDEGRDSSFIIFPIVRGI